MKHLLQNKWYVSAMAGILLGLSFPPVDLPILIIPAFVLFLHLGTLCKGYREYMAVSYVAFVIWNLITTYWLMMASFSAGIAAVLANAVLMTIPLAMMRFLMRRYKMPLLDAITLPLIWIFYEYLHHIWELAWPWLAIGNAWSNYPIVVQYISVTGMMGIGFWMVSSSVLTYHAITKSSKKYGLIGLIVFLVFPICSVLITVFESADEEYPTMEVAIIQPNFDSYFRFGGWPSQDKALDSIMELTDSTVTDSTELVIWPENAIDSNVRLYSRHMNRVADSAITWNTNFLVGAGIVKEYVEEIPLIYRERNGFKYNIFNSAVYIEDDGQREFYEKRNLVPIVERVPYANFLAKVDRFDLIDWGRITGFGKGEVANSFPLNDDFKTPGLVCYDSVFPNWVRHFINDDATFITIITNDGWWGNTSGHHQHFAYARLRAIEFDRWITRSANNGISGIIAPDGSIKVKTDYWVETGFTYEIEARNSKTIYARLGDWLPLYGGLLSLAVFIYGYVRDPFPRSRKIGWLS